MTLLKGSPVERTQVQGQVGGWRLLHDNGCFLREPGPSDGAKAHMCKHTCAQHTHIHTHTHTAQAYGFRHKSSPLTMLETLPRPKHRSPLRRMLKETGPVACMSPAWESLSWTSVGGWLRRGTAGSTGNQGSWILSPLCAS